EAIATASHITNLIPRKGKKNIPFELFFGHKFSLEHLKVFGCVAFFYVLKQHRDKLEPRSETGIMVGYARSRSGYRIYDIKNQR
ncbi:Retrovirus-related Pol polyprotein from transposon TNT 1-94, partial [Acromyrmex echinatior]